VAHGARRRSGQTARRGRELLIVSSGSISLGRSRLKLPAAPWKLEESQAAAAVGQIALARNLVRSAGHHGIGAGQILVTLQDTEERPPLFNARSTIANCWNGARCPSSTRTTPCAPMKNPLRRQ